MLYWKVSKQTLEEQSINDRSFEKSGEYLKPGPPCKLSLEQEFMLTMMRLCLGLFFT